MGYTSCGLYNHGYTRKNGIATYIDVPGATQTSVLGINDEGVAVGWYIVPGECLECAFVWKSGKYLSFSYPGAAATFASGINKTGQVGSYTFDYQAYHGFITDPITSLDFP